MTNPNGRKGTKWEVDCRDYLARWWPKNKRPRTEGSKDKGDLTHPEGWGVECKNATPITLPAWLREAEAEAGHKGVTRFVVLVKNRRSRGESGTVADGYAVTRTRVWAQVAHEHEQATATLDEIGSLTARYDTGKVTPQAYCVLVSEALLRHAEGSV